MVADLELLLADVYDGSMPREPAFIDTCAAFAWQAHAWGAMLQA